MFQLHAICYVLAYAWVTSPPLLVTPLRWRCLTCATWTALSDEYVCTCNCSTLGLAIGCDLLGLLPSEVEKLDISRPHRVEMAESLSTILVDILAVSGNCICDLK